MAEIAEGQETQTRDQILQSVGAPPDPDPAAASAAQQPEGQVVDAASQAETSQADQKTALQQTYTVESGDTLSAIAERFYGDANAYNRIFEANRDKVDNADLIYPGQELVIPR